MRLWRYGRAIERLGQRYRLEGALGSGGMADVCLAWDEREGREVAIKVIRTDELDQKALDRFMKEAAQVAQWNHPNILRIYSDLKLELLDAAQGSIVPYIVMEYAQGGDLQKRLQPGQPYPLSEVLTIFPQLCSAVSYAHAQGVIHRDLKPLNILFRVLPDDSEKVVLSDFGLAVEIKATHHTYAHGGTLPYMAPEQLQGSVLPASDIFALGVILYQLCTGQLPFRRTLQNLWTPAAYKLPPRPSLINRALPPELDEIIFTALAAEPADRFSDALDLWLHLQAIFFDSTMRPPSKHTLHEQARSCHPEHHPCHPERSEGSASLVHQILSEARDDRGADFPRTGGKTHYRAPNKAQGSRSRNEANSTSNTPRQSRQQSKEDQRMGGAGQKKENRQMGGQEQKQVWMEERGTGQRNVRMNGGDDGWVEGEQIHWRMNGGDGGWVEGGHMNVRMDQSDALRSGYDGGEMWASSPDGSARSIESSDPRLNGSAHPASARSIESSDPRPIASDPQPIELSSHPQPIDVADRPRSTRPPTLPTNPAYNVTNSSASPGGVGHRVYPSADLSAPPPPIRHLPHSSASAPAHPSASSLSLAPRSIAPNAHRSRPPRRTDRVDPSANVFAPAHGNKTRPTIVTLIGLILLLIAGGTLAFVPVVRQIIPIAIPNLSNKMTVTIVPASKPISHTYTLTAVMGAPDPAQQQIPARMLVAQVPSQQKMVNATGVKNVPGTRATGKLTFMNGSFTRPFTVNAGYTIVGADGIAVITDNTITIPVANPNTGDGQTTVSAHAVTAGMSGNIAALDINHVCCISDNSVFVKNPAAFTGGQDPQNYKFVQQSDVDNVANPLKATMIQQGVSALKVQAGAHAQPVEPLQGTLCTPRVTSDQPIGDSGRNVDAATITVGVTCQVEVYDQAAAIDLARQQLRAQAAASFGSGYTLSDNIQARVVVQGVDQQRDVALQVAASGVAFYRFGDGQRQLLARAIAGKSRDAAIHLLRQYPGVMSVTIPADGVTLPGDAARINIVVQSSGVQAGSG